MKSSAFIFLFALILISCKPKEQQQEKSTQSAQSSQKQEKEEYLNWKKRIEFGEDIIRNRLGTYSTNVIFDSHYKYVGENDGYICGRVQWVDTYKQKENDDYYYVYLKFAGGKVSDSSKPMIFNAEQEYEMKKYKMFCSLD